MWVLWYRVVAAASPRVASLQSTYGKPKTFYWSVFYDGLSCILRACGLKSARGWGERRDASLIKPYWQ